MLMAWVLFPSLLPRKDSEMCLVLIVARNGKDPYQPPSQIVDAGVSPTTGWHGNTQPTKLEQV